MIFSTRPRGCRRRPRLAPPVSRAHPLQARHRNVERDRIPQRLRGPDGEPRVRRELGLWWRVSPLKNPTRDGMLAGALPTSGVRAVAAPSVRLDGVGPAELAVAQDATGVAAGRVDHDADGAVPVEGAQLPADDTFGLAYAADKGGPRRPEPRPGGPSRGGNLRASSSASPT
jgi:hypothetical protein